MHFVFLLWAYIRHATTYARHASNRHARGGDIATLPYSSHVYADSYSCTLWGRDQVRRVCVGRAIVTQSNALCVQVRVLYPWLLHCANRRADSNPNFSSTLVSTMRSSINIVRLCRRVAALELRRQCNRALSRKPPERAHGSVTHRWLDAYSDYVNLQLRLADIEHVCDTFAVAARA